MGKLETLGEEVVKNKARLKELEIKFEALINLLEKEGVVIKQEVEQEFNELVKEL